MNLLLLLHIHCSRFSLLIYDLELFALEISAVMHIQTIWSPIVKSWNILFLKKDVHTSYSSEIIAQKEYKIRKFILNPHEAWLLSETWIEESLMHWVLLLYQLC